MNLFTYGSLMFPEVWERVTGLTDPGRPATLPHHAARCIRGRSYPALVPEQGKVTAGVLYSTVPADAMARLDVFEGSFYDRIQVAVTLADGTAVSASVYRAAAGAEPDILPDAWEADQFATSGLVDFLRTDAGFSRSGQD